MLIIPAQYAIATNFAENLFSVYNPGEDDPIFQIDANLGHPAAVLNALIQAPDTASYEEPLVVTLLPALPQQWAASGSMKGARLRGGLSVDFSWKNGKLDGATFTVSDNVRPRDVRVVADRQVVKEFTTEAGLIVQI